MGAGKGQSRRVQSKSKASARKKRRSSVLDPTLLQAPDINSGDLASVEVSSYPEENEFSDYPYDAISEVQLVAKSPQRIIGKLLEISGGVGFAAEVNKNPLLLYGCVRAARRFQRAVGRIPVDWQAEPYYYGDQISSLTIGPGYDAAVADLAKEVEDLYQLARQKKNDEIVERSLVADHGRAYAALTGKAYSLQNISPSQLLKARSSHDAYTDSTYREEMNEAMWTLNSLIRANPVYVALAQQLQAQPVAVVEQTPRGYRLLEGGKSLATYEDYQTRVLKNQITQMPVLVAA